MQKPRSRILGITGVLVFLPLLLSCSGELVTATPPGGSVPLTPQPPVTGAAPGLGQRTKTSGCMSANNLPDPACTPGAIFPTATVSEICIPGYTTKVRNVPIELKDQVYAEYGIASHEPGQYEVDHLIPLEVGGSNDIANLWPEPADPRPGFHEKDQLENYLHDEVCSGRISLQQAQLEIAKDWVTVYNSMP